MRRIAVYMATVFLGSMAFAGETTIDWCRQSITDTSIAKGMRRGPVSVEHAINLLEDRIAKGSLKDLEVLDLSENNIGLEGATQFLKYLARNLPSLEKLHLSFNPIQINRHSDPYQVEAFEDALQELLRNPSFESVLLQGIPVSEEYQKFIIQRLTTDLVRKIHW